MTTLKLHGTRNEAKEEFVQPGELLQHNPLIAKSALAKLHKEVFGWALYQCHFDRDEAEEVVQIAYVNILEGSAVYAAESALKTWLFALVRNVSRQRSRNLRSRMRLMTQKMSTLVPEASHESTVSPESQLHFKRQGNRLMRAVGKLPYRQREIVGLVFIRDMSIADAAQVMGVTIGTARAHYERAKRSLAGSLAAELLNA